MHTKFGSGLPPLSMTEGDGKGKGKRLGTQARDGDAAYLKHKIQFGEHLCVIWLLGVTARTFGSPGMHGRWKDQEDLAAAEGVQLVIRGRDPRERNQRAREQKHARKGERLQCAPNLGSGWTHKVLVHKAARANWQTKGQLRRTTTSEHGQHWRSCEWTMSSSRLGR